MKQTVRERALDYLHNPSILCSGCLERKGGTTTERDGRFIQLLQEKGVHQLNFATCLAFSCQKDYRLNLGPGSHWDCHHLKTINTSQSKAD